MKKLLIFSLLFSFIYQANAQLWLVDPLEAIYPDTNKLTDYNAKWKAAYPLHGIASVHVLIKVPLGEVLMVSATINNAELGMENWSQLIDVPVEQNTGLDSRTEQYLGNSNPHVIRKAPFRVFEVIKPLENSKIKSFSTYTALRLTVPSNFMTAQGTQKVAIKISSNGTVFKGQFTVKVYPVELPKLSDSQFFYTNWFNLTKMETEHSLERWTDSWFEMLDKYAKLMAYGRQNSITIPNELFKYENGNISLDEEKMLRFIDVFRTNGFKYFEAPHLMNRGENDDWGDPELKVALTKNRYYKEKGEKDIEDLINLIYAFVVKNNLTNSWLQHISDEPTAVQAACYKDIAKQIKVIYPEIKIMEATNDREGIAGAIDIWCPLINDFQENEAFFREREKLGEKVLVYSCLIPGGKWLNRTLDMEKLRQVYFGWGAAHYNTGGYLHWGLNQYMTDPFDQSVVHHPAPGAAANNFLPAGDTHIVYPDEKGPLSSLRFEAHRVGSEDYDLLQLLKVQHNKEYLKIVKKQFRSYTDYNLSISDYRKSKEKLLQKIN